MLPAHILTLQAQETISKPQLKTLTPELLT